MNSILILEINILSWPGLNSGRSTTKFNSRYLKKLKKGGFDVEENQKLDKFQLRGVSKTRSAVKERKVWFFHWFSFVTQDFHLRESSRWARIYKYMAQRMVQAVSNIFEAPEQTFLSFVIRLKIRIIKFLQKVWTTKYCCLEKRTVSQQFYLLIRSLLITTSHQLHKQQTDMFLKGKQPFVSWKCTGMIVVSLRKTKTLPFELFSKKLVGRFFETSN